MNILLVASKYPPEHSGSGKRLHELYRRLQGRYGDVTWEALSTRNRDLGTGVHEGIRVFRVPGAREAGGIRPLLVSRLVEIIYGLRELLLALRHMRTISPGKIDVVHTCGWSWCVLAACIWARRNGIPLIRELTSMSDHPYSPSWMRPVIRRTLQWATMIVAISPYLADSCNRAGFLKKVWCRPNPIDEERFRPLSQRERQEVRNRLFPEVVNDRAVLLLNLGRIRPIKNQLVLIDLLGRLPEHYFLVLAGPVSAEHQSYLDKIHKKIDELGLGERVIIRVGTHPNPEDFFQASDLFLFPSVSEGLGTVLLEAMMCGLPVVANPLEGITDSFIEKGRNGYLVSFEDELAPGTVERGASLLKEKSSISGVAKERFGAAKIDREYHDHLQAIIEGSAPVFSP